MSTVVIPDFHRQYNDVYTRPLVTLIARITPHCHLIPTVMHTSSINIIALVKVLTAVND